MLKKATGELPYFADNLPAAGIAANTPSEAASKHKLKVEFEISKVFLISGILATNAPTTRPLVMKVIVTASRACFNKGESTPLG